MARNEPPLMEGCQHASFSNVASLCFVAAVPATVMAVPLAPGAGLLPKTAPVSTSPRLDQGFAGPFARAGASTGGTAATGTDSPPGRTDSRVGSSWFLATRTARMSNGWTCVPLQSWRPLWPVPMAPNDDTKRGETPPTLREKYCVWNRCVSFVLVKHCRSNISIWLYARIISDQPSLILQDIEKLQRHHSRSCTMSFSSLSRLHKATIVKWHFAVGFLFSAISLRSNGQNTFVPWGEQSN